MSDLLRTCTQKTFVGSRAVTSFQELPHGTTLSLWPDGPQIVKSGRGAHPANLSPRQAKELGLMTSGTSGLPSTTSSRSAGLQKSLESRLRANTSILGSTLFKMTWKPWVTPSGRSRSRLRASVLRTSETVFTGVPTPGHTFVDHKPRPPVIGSRKATDPQIGLADVAVWLMGRGPTPNGALAEMGEADRLNPEYPRWLMGLPVVWSSCAPTEMPSRRRPRARSSKQ